MKHLFAFVFLILSTAKAFAYIPPYWLIMSKTADQHGKGLYLIDQDVIFQSAAGEPLVVNERWIIQNENSMRLEVTGRKQLKDLIRLTFVYEDGKRYVIDENGVKKSARVPGEFFEPLFHFRFSKNIKPYLVEQKIVPSESLRSEPHKYSPKKPHADPESFVRLARSGGVVTYAIGTPSSPGTDDMPGLWIDQDQFVVRKVRYPSRITITAQDYRSWSQGLMLPKEREVTFGSHSVVVTVNSVSPVTLTPQVKSKLTHSSLNFGENPQLSSVLPTEQAIRDFYLRLR